MSYAPEVRTGTDPKWYGNALRFATEQEAENNVRNLASRWLLVTDTRVVESDEPVNYRWTIDGLVRVGAEA